MCLVRQRVISVIGLLHAGEVGDVKEARTFTGVRRHRIDLSAHCLGVSFCCLSMAFWQGRAYVSFCCLSMAFWQGRAYVSFCCLSMAFWQGRAYVSFWQGRAYAAK